MRKEKMYIEKTFLFNLQIEKKKPNFYYTLICFKFFFLLFFWIFQ